MLYAITKNKAGRNLTKDKEQEDKEQVNWRQLFKTSEDSLTSTVFERLFYLPSELFYKILRESCYSKELPKHSGKLLLKEFWPHWDGKNTYNQQMVEPDVFIRFEEFDLIIEAKRWDNKQQSATQWENEIIAYRNEYADDNKKLYLIALGGLHNQKSEERLGVRVIKCRWSRILTKVVEQQKLLTNEVDTSGYNEMVSAVLNDLILSFRIHGFFTGEWFQTLPIQKYAGINSEQILVQNQVRFDSQNWFNTLPLKYKINTTQIL